MAETLYRMVNGIRQEITPDEAAAIRAEWATASFAGAKSALAESFRAEALRRIGLAEPALNDEKCVALMALLWPMLNTGAAPAGIVRARQIYAYARQSIQAVNAAPDLAALAGIDPKADLPFGAGQAGWP